MVDDEHPRLVTPPAVHPVPGARRVPYLAATLMTGHRSSFCFRPREFCISDPVCLQYLTLFSTQYDLGAVAFTQRHQTAQLHGLFGAAMENRPGLQARTLAHLQGVGMVVVLGFAGVGPDPVQLYNKIAQARLIGEKVVHVLRLCL